VTVWVALSSMRVAEGGGIAVARGTHRDAEPWMSECRAVIASGGTCYMDKLSPDCVRKLDAISQVILTQYVYNLMCTPVCNTL
jgi:hypothetical protein